MTDQAALRRALEARIPPGFELGDRTVIAVLRDVDLPDYAEGALGFTLALDPDQARAWWDSLTRTVFLAGDPARIARRHPPDHVAPGGSAAWYGPAGQDDHHALRLLLRAFEGEAECERAWHRNIKVPGTEHERAWHRNDDVPGTRRLHLDVRGLSWQASLVHLNHAICEAALAGELRPGDVLELTDDPAPGPPWAHARVGTDPDDPERLRLFAALAPAAEEPDHGP